MKIKYKPMHVYKLHRSNDLDHENGRPAIFLDFFGLESLVWIGTTQRNLTLKDKPLSIIMNKKATLFYNNGLLKVKTKHLKNVWKDNTTKKIIMLSAHDQQSLISKFANFTYQRNPYQEIFDLEQQLTQNQEIINKAVQCLELIDAQNLKIKTLASKITKLEKQLKKEKPTHGL